VRQTIGLSVLLLLSAEPPASAQASRRKDADWFDDLSFLSANALLGGVTAGIVCFVKDRAFRKGFTDGMLGGGVTYVGKRLAAARFSGAGLLGREVTAVGGSIVRNASLGAGIVDTLVLPIGPLRAFLTPSGIGNTRLRLDLSQTGRLLAGLTERRLALDWRRTLSAGAPVFVTDARIRSEDELVRGAAAQGVIVLSRVGSGYPEDVFAHERVHVIQEDFAQTTVGLPLELWGRDKVGLDRIPLVEHIILGFTYEAIWWPMDRIWRHADRPWEIEAQFLEARGHEASWRPLSYAWSQPLAASTWSTPTPPRRRLLCCSSASPPWSSPRIAS
jgi:hypothetical protein